MIHPAGWRNVDGDYKGIQELLKSIDIEWLSIHNHDDGRKNFGVGSRYDMYVAVKANTPGHLTKIRDENGKTDLLCLKNVDFIPNFNLKSVINLIADKSKDRVDFAYESRMYEARKSNTWMSDKKTSKFRYPCVYTMNEGGITNCWYTDNKKCHFGESKVIFSVWHATGVYVDMRGKYGMCQDVAAIKDKSNPDNLHLIAKAMRSKRFHDIMRSVRFADRTWNRHVIKLFRKDFWKEFVDAEGNFLDENGDIIYDEEIILSDSD